MLVAVKIAGKNHCCISEQPWQLQKLLLQAEEVQVIANLSRTGLINSIVSQVLLGSSCFMGMMNLPRYKMLSNLLQMPLTHW